MGGNIRSQNNMLHHKRVMDNCGLIDLGYKGHPFTWLNRREMEDNNQYQLDRGNTRLHQHIITNQRSPLTQV